MAKLHKDWSDFLKSLNAHRVKFVVVGAHALAAAGRPRLTADLDVLVEPTLVNARRVVRALEAFGFGGLAPEKLVLPETVVFLGRAPFRIDILSSIDGVDFPTALRGGTKGRLGGQPVVYLGRAELIVNKRAAGRPKDLADLALLAESEEERPARRPTAARRTNRKKAR